MAEEPDAQANSQPWLPKHHSRVAGSLNNGGAFFGLASFGSAEAAGGGAEAYSEGAQVLPEGAEAGFGRALSVVGYNRQVHKAKQNCPTMHKAKLKLPQDARSETKTTPRCTKRN